MSGRIGFVANGDVTLENGKELRIYGYANAMGNVPYGQFTAQIVGEKHYFQGMPRLVSFSAPTKVHVEVIGMLDGKRASLFADLSGGADGKAGKVEKLKVQFDSPVEKVWELTEPQLISKAANDPREAGEMILVYAPAPVDDVEDPVE